MLTLLILAFILPIMLQILLLVLVVQLHLHPRPWSIIECSQLAAWKTNRSLLVASRVKAFPGRPTNSGSTLPRVENLEGGVIGCHRCITSHSESSPASPNMRPNPWLCPACIPCTKSIPAPTQPTIAMTDYTHGLTVTNSSAFHAQL